MEAWLKTCSVRGLPFLHGLGSWLLRNEQSGNKATEKKKKSFLSNQRKRRQKRKKKDKRASTRTSDMSRDAIARHHNAHPHHIIHTRNLAQRSRLHRLEVVAVLN
jgi:hypothetical protein